MSGLRTCDVVNLAKLLRSENEESKSDEEIEQNILSPAQIGPPKANSKETKSRKVVNEGEIWDSDEVPESDNLTDSRFDPRIRPEYEIIYKQEVTPEDIYLQLGNKTASSSSCQAMVITIQLPGVKGCDITVDVERETLDVRTPSHRLALHLPHPVHKDKGTASWDPDKQTLKLTLFMDREFDFINF